MTPECLRDVRPPKLPLWADFSFLINSQELSKKFAKIGKNPVLCQFWGYFLRASTRAACPMFASYNLSIFFLTQRGIFLGPQPPHARQRYEQKYGRKASILPWWTFDFRPHKEENARETGRIWQIGAFTAERPFLSKKVVFGHFALRFKRETGKCLFYSVKAPLFLCEWPSPSKMPSYCRKAAFLRKKINCISEILTKKDAVFGLFAF